MNPITQLYRSYSLPRAERTTTEQSRAVVDYDGDDKCDLNRGHTIYTIAQLEVRDK